MPLFTPQPRGGGTPSRAGQQGWGDGGAAPSMCANRSLASSAALAASRGRMNTLGTDSIAAMDRISLEHLRAHAGPRELPHRPSMAALGPGSRCQVVGFPSVYCQCPAFICATANSQFAVRCVLSLSGPLLLQPTCLSSSFCILYVVCPMHPLPASSRPLHRANHCVAAPGSRSSAACSHLEWHTFRHMYHRSALTSEHRRHCIISSHMPAAVQGNLAPSRCTLQHDMSACRQC